MSWGPNDNLDMFWKPPKRKGLVDPESKRLHCGPDILLIVELDDDGWSWLERNKHTKKYIVQRERFETFLECVQNYRECTRHDS
jgi:hypothetical protein